MAETTNPSNPIKLDEMTVLVVDDTPGNIDVLVRILKPEGYRIAVANSGEQALALVPRVKPDLILLDVMMPGINGFETCRKLKENPETAGAPVIFITAKTQTEDVVAGFAAGGVDYINKPIRQEEVLARTRTHLTLRATIKQLIETNAQKSRFLGIAAHDLRSPLNAVIGFSDLIVETCDNGDTADMATRIGHVATEMLTLVDDLLDVAAIETGKFTLKLSPANLVSLVQEKIEHNRFRANKKSIQVELASDPLENIQLDPSRLAQVVDNLLSNAIKFSPPGATVRVTVSDGDNMAEIRVADQGPGISPEDQKHLFTNPHQLSTKATGGEKCTGFGLAIAKKVVDAHGGKIFAEPNQGGGSVFTVMIPKKP